MSHGEISLSGNAPAICVTPHDGSSWEQAVVFLYNPSSARLIALGTCDLAPLPAARNSTSYCDFQNGASMNPTSGATIFLRVCFEGAVCALLPMGVVCMIVYRRPRQARNAPGRFARCLCASSNARYEFGGNPSSRFLRDGRGEGRFVAAGPSRSSPRPMSS